MPPVTTRLPPRVSTVPPRLPTTTAEELARVPPWVLALGALASAGGLVANAAYLSTLVL
jgi:hypothetical protein